MANEPRRLSILSSHEIDELFGLPNFSDDDRRLYFDLSAKEREAVEDIRTFSVAAHLVLQLGYFKAKRQFFLYEQEISVLNGQSNSAQYFSYLIISCVTAKPKLLWKTKHSG